MVSTSCACESHGKAEIAEIGIFVLHYARSDYKHHEQTVQLFAATSMQQLNYTSQDCDRHNHHKNGWINSLKFCP